MSLPDPIAPRKLSPLGLYVPFGLLLLFIAALSCAWLWASGQVTSRMDAGVAALKSAGYQVDWKDRKVGGYPFRLNVTLSDVRIRDRSGWALEASTLEGQAFMHAPTTWIIAAPKGLTFVRPVGGPVRVTGRLVRASLSHFTATPPSFSFEGTGLTFEPAPGAQPFGLSAAERVEIHLRQAPKEVGDEAGFWVSVKDGKAQLTGLLGRIAGDKPISIEWDGRLSKISAFHGSDWPAAVRSWTAAGGRMSVKRAGLTAGDALIGANSGTLSVGSDGRLTGVLDVSLRQAPRALSALGAAGAIPQGQADAAAAVAAARAGTGDLARATINFESRPNDPGPRRPRASTQGVRALDVGPWWSMASLYDRFVLPGLLKCACSSRPVMKQRGKVVPKAEGRVLELGIGMGLNLGFYDADKVESVTGVDPAAELRAIAEAAPRDPRLTVKVEDGTAEALPFEAASFDSVVCTFTLCSVQTPAQALAEALRVLKPGGRLLYCEHGLAPDPDVAKWQRRVEPIWKRMAGGCHLTRPITAAVEAAGFKVVSRDSMYIPGTPRIAGGANGARRRPKGSTSTSPAVERPAGRRPAVGSAVASPRAWRRGRW